MKGTAQWTPDMAGGLTIDRSGNRWKVYANGRTLCAHSRPYHNAYDSQNRDTNGPCDCINREGETIATFTFALKEIP